MIPLEQGGCCLARYNASNPVLPTKKDHILSRYRPIAPRPIAPRPIAPKPDSTAASPPPADLQSSSSMSVGSRAPGSSDITTSTRGRRSRKRLADRAPAGGGGRVSSANKRSFVAKVDARAAAAGQCGAASAAASVSPPAPKQQQQGQVGFMSRFGLASAGPDMSVRAAAPAMSMHSSAAVEQSAAAAAAAAGAHHQALARQHQHMAAGGGGQGGIRSDLAEGSLSSALTLSSGTGRSVAVTKERHLGYEDPYAKMVVSPYSSSVGGSIFHQDKCPTMSHISSSAGSFLDNAGGLADRDAAFMERAAASAPAVFPDSATAAAAPVNRLLHTYSGGFSEMLKGIAGCTAATSGGGGGLQHHHPLDHTTSASAVTTGLDVTSTRSSPHYMSLDLNASASGMAQRGSGAVSALDLNRTAQGGECSSPGRMSADMRSRSLRRPPLGHAVTADRDVPDMMDRCGRPQLVTLSLLPDTPSHVRACASDAASSACTFVGLSLGSDHGGGMFRQDAAADTGAAPCRESAVFSNGRCLEDRFELLRSRELERESLVHGGHHHCHSEGQAVEAKPLLDTFRELVSRASIAGSKPACDPLAAHHHHTCGGGDREEMGQQAPKVIDLAYLEQVYGGSSDPLMLTDENQVVMWYNPAFKRASSDRNSRQGHAMSPYIDPLGVPTRLSSCLFQATPTAKCRAVLWGFLKKFVTLEVGAGCGGPAAASAAASASCNPGCNNNSSSIRLGGGGRVPSMSCSPRPSGELAEEKRLQERNFFGIGLPYVEQACQNDCSLPSSHTVIAPQPVRPVGSLGNSTTLTRLLAAVKPAE